MASKIRNKWKKWANDLNQADIKNPVIKKIAVYTSWLMVNTFIFMTTMAITSFVLFAIAFSIDDSNIIGDYIFLSALIAFSPIILAGVAGVLYSFIYLPIRFVINKFK